jgi:hypothetical protein
VYIGLASAYQTTLNQLFRDWLGYVSAPLAGDQVKNALRQFGYFRVGRMPSRNERNER